MQCLWWRNILILRSAPEMCREQPPRDVDVSGAGLRDDATNIIVAAAKEEQYNRNGAKDEDAVGGTPCDPGRTPAPVNSFAQNFRWRMSVCILKLLPRMR